MKLQKKRPLIPFAISFLFCSVLAHADESTVVLPPAEFTGSATFETLNQDTYVPVYHYRISGERSSTLDSLKYDTPYPVQNYGYPSGASGVSLGGRSVEDTQVTTLGIPLNLPQGGGADFSFFPGFLWKEAILSPSTSGSGFSPSSASGRLELIPWTRAKLLDPRGVTENSRLTLSYDRNLQTYSLASAQKDVALLAGATSGKMQGYSGELSYYLRRAPGSHLILHAIGTNQKGDSPGPLSAPSPLAKKEVWRVLPVLESHQDFGDFVFESTLYADFQQLKYTDPALPAYATNTHTQQYGIENAVVNGPNTLGLSARYVRFESISFNELSEWPVYGSFTRDFFLSNETSFKATLNGDYLSKVGFEPGAKVSAKFAANPKTYPFAELNTLGKMPSLNARYYQFGTFFHGNPNLKPERVNAALFGYALESGKFKSTSTLKAEYRKSIQVTAGDTTINQGNAYLFSLNEELGIPLTSWIRVFSNTHLTQSQLTGYQQSYPDLPFLSESAGLSLDPNDYLGFDFRAKYMGPSTASGGAFHAPYTLVAIAGTYHFSGDVQASLGVDNLFNTDAQAILDYPLEGRTAFASLQANF